MALPQDGQNANALATVKEVPTGKKLIFVDPTTNEGGVITLEDLITQILKNLTSQTFALDQGTKTLPAALNELNSKTPSKYVNSLENYMKNAPIGVSFCDCQKADDNPDKGTMSICMTFVNDDHSWGVQYLFVYESIRYRTMSNGAVDKWRRII